MADLGFSINTEELPESTDFSPVPENNYNVIMTASHLNPTNKTKKLMEEANISSYDEFRKMNPLAEGFLALELDIQDGPYTGRKLFHNLNLINDSQEASKFAASQLRQILEAFKMKNFSGKSEELHGKRMVVFVKIEPAKPYMQNGIQKPGFPSNKCVKFSSPNGTAASGATTQTAMTSTEKKGPWAR